MVDCPKCGKDFESEWGMKSHYGQVHEGSIAGIQKECVSCGGSFTVYPHRSDAKYCSNECKRNRVTVECAACGEELERQEWRVEENERQFCDQKCHGSWLSENRSGENNPLWKERRLVECDWCGGTIERRPSHPELERDFCSSECYGAWLSENNTGPNNPRWVEENAEIYYGPNWEEQREKRLDRDGYECVVCGISQEEHKERYRCELNIHHITSIRKYIEDGEVDYERANRVENLISLCLVCHGKWEGIPLRPQ